MSFFVFIYLFSAEDRFPFFQESAGSFAEISGSEELSKFFDLGLKSVSGEVSAIVYCADGCLKCQWSIFKDVSHQASAEREQLTVFSNGMYEQVHRQDRKSKRLNHSL